MTVTDVAGYLQVSRITIYRLVKKGLLPAFKVGRVLRFRRNDLKALTKSTSNFPTVRIRKRK
jgi:excisionase family DNA binding protein